MMGYGVYRLGLAGFTAVRIWVHATRQCTSWSAICTSTVMTLAPVSVMDKCGIVQLVMDQQCSGDTVVEMCCSGTKAGNVKLSTSPPNSFGTDAYQPRVLSLLVRRTDSIAYTHHDSHCQVVSTCGSANATSRPRVHASASSISPESCYLDPCRSHTHDRTPNLRFSHYPLECITLKLTVVSARRSDKVESVIQLSSFQVAVHGQYGERAEEPSGRSGERRGSQDDVMASCAGDG
jgi:hypothetical protein